MKFNDIKGFFKKTRASVECIDNPFGDYYTVKLKTEKGLEWRPGEYGVFRLPGHKIKGQNYRNLSVASTPQEGFMLLAMRTGEQVSDFKKVLLNMSKGDCVALRGPFGSFGIQDNVSPMILFAADIGITPIRSIVKSLENDKTRNIEIVYSSHEYYLFENELLDIASNNPMVKLYKTGTRDESRDRIQELAKLYGNEAFYYNSGSPRTIKAIRGYLREEGIKKKRMLDDLFFGS